MRVLPAALSNNRCEGPVGPSHRVSVTVERDDSLVRALSYFATPMAPRSAKKEVAGLLM